MPESYLADSRSDVHAQNSLFEALPGEIRNLVFEYYILNAAKSTKEAPRSTTRAAKDIELSILPRWHGPARVRMSGIGTIPLLFVSKRINLELGSLVYSKINNLRIGGYILQHPKDSLASPSSNYAKIYPLLLNAKLCRYTKNIKLKLPSIRADLHCRYDDLRGFSVAGFRTQQSSPNFDAIMAVIPSLIESLKRYECLESLEVTISVELRTPPDFQPLLPLWDLCGIRSNVIFVGSTEYYGIQAVTTWWQFTEQWDKSWKDCLAEHRRAKSG